MKTLKQHIAEAADRADNPVVGDNFAIEILDECLIESYVVGTTEDGIVIEGDERLLQLLEDYGYLGERIARYGAVGSNTGVGFSVGENANSNDPLLSKAIDDAAVPPLEEETGCDEEDQHLRRMMELSGCQTKMEGTEGGRDTVEFDIPTFIRMLEYAREDAKTDMDLHNVTEKVIELSQEDRVLTMDDYDTIVGPADEEPAAMDEAEYQGREVPLGKPMKGDVKKSKVYVRGPKGNVVKVNFGDPNMRIKKSNPERRKSFRARHNCDNPGPRWKARYWSCRAW